MNEHLKRDFALNIRRQLGRYPVWEPGAPFELGDYGVLRDKTLHKLGNIREFGIAFSVLKGNEAPYQFQSAGTQVLGAQASGSVEPSGLNIPLRAAVELHFDQEHGIFINAQRSRVLQIKNLRQIALELRKSAGWRFKWKFVSELREMSPATIIMGSTAGTTIKIEGEANLLKQFDIGGLKAGTGISFTGESALQLVGVEGPIFLDLCYLPIFWREDINQAAVEEEGLPEEPFANLGAQVSIQDDDDAS